ncbi:hypothetical protein V7S76_02615 [Aquirufa sp. ROCK2-A2]
MKNKHGVLYNSIFHLALFLGSSYHILSHFSEYFHDPSFKDLFAAFVVVPLLGYAGISDLVKTIRLWKNDN